MGDFAYGHYDLDAYSADKFIAEREDQIITKYVDGSPGDNDDAITSVLNVSVTTSENSVNVPAYTDEDESTTATVNAAKNVNWGIAVAASVLFLLASAMCGYAMFRISRRRQLSAQTTHWYIFQVIFSNTVLTLTLPLFLFEEIFKGKSNIGTAFVVTKNTVISLNYFTCVLFLTYISVGQFLTACRRKMLLQINHQEKRVTYAVTMLTWVVSLTLCIPIAVNVSQTWFTVFLCYFSIMFVLPLAIISFFYTITMFCYWKTTKGCMDDNNELSVKKCAGTSANNVEAKKISTDENPTVKSQQRTAVVHLLIALCFFVCWLFFFVLCWKRSFEGNPSLPTSFPTTIDIVAVFLVYFCSALIPLVFVIGDLKGHFSKKPSDEESVTMPS